MKWTFLLILSLFLPWVAFIFVEKPLSALGALALQLTFVGWLPASIWAWITIKQLKVAATAQEKSTAESTNSPDSGQP